MRLTLFERKLVDVKLKLETCQLHCYLQFYYSSKRRIQLVNALSFMCVLGFNRIHIILIYKGKVWSLRCPPSSTSTRFPPLVQPRFHFC